MKLTTAPNRLLEMVITRVCELACEEVGGGADPTLVRAPTRRKDYSTGLSRRRRGGQESSKARWLTLCVLKRCVMRMSPQGERPIRLWVCFGRLRDAERVAVPLSWLLAASLLEIDHSAVPRARNRQRRDLSCEAAITRIMHRLLGEYGETGVECTLAAEAWPPAGSQQEGRSAFIQGM
jgi:hypothetical protein